MPAKDEYHDCVKNALIKDGWVITHDPLRLSWGGKDLVVHIDIIDGKLWIQRDGTEHGIAKELLRAGIPKDQIVLAFKRHEVRRLTEYAVAWKIGPRGIREDAITRCREHSPSPASSSGFSCRAGTAPIAMAGSHSTT
jgi:hypothetical protein